jgi:hypothetical protein
VVVYVEQGDELGYVIAVLRFCPANGFNAGIGETRLIVQSFVELFKFCLRALVIALYRF